MLDRLKIIWFHIKTYTFTSKERLCFDIEDDTVDWLLEEGWIYKHRGEYYFSQKGTDEFKKLLDLNIN